MNSKNIIEKLKIFFKNREMISSEPISPLELHETISSAVMENIEENWAKTKQLACKNKRAYYLSAEFLVGRAIFNNLVCLNIFDDLKNYLAKKNIDLNCLEKIEDSALGNGGLGRLAACFLDSAATLNIPLDGYGIRYKFGLFKQKIEHGFQKEYADDWTKFGDPWSRRCIEDVVKIEFKDETVNAVPFDMPIIGYGTSCVGTLRLWQAEAPNSFNFEKFNNYEFDEAIKEKNSAERISAVLYPNDSEKMGKVLRFKQQYFFCSASMQDIIKKFKQNNSSDFSKLPQYVAIQLNDTHPVISIAELIRLLCEKENLKFEEAFEIARKCFAYTNHTIMSEALEKWPKSLISEVIPNILKYIEKIQETFIAEMTKHNISKEITEKISPIQKDIVNMAHLAVYSTSYTNGVAKIHTEILKNSLLKDWFNIYPERFQNKTNGITQRRWLLLCNKELACFITKKLKSDSWILNLSKLKELEKFAQDTSTIEEFKKIKLLKHKQLVDHIKNYEGIELDAETIFDVQIKRLHEYKRQLLNILTILEIYFRIKDGTIKNFHKTTFIFGAKAAPGYRRAKGIIKLINAVADLIEKDDAVKNLIKIIFVQNYNVSYAEKIIAAADVSEQISTAGTEASGTGNMKFMLNGAVTLGTFDGANIEIVEEAGAENNYIFGKTCEEIEKISQNYDPATIYESNPSIKRVLDSLTNGLLDDCNTGIFCELKDSILKGASWHRPDQYYLLADFESYLETRLKVNNDFKDSSSFAKKCLINIANAGKFSSDRTIRDYAENIWHIKPIKI